MAWFLCTISKSEKKNWELCKAVGLFGYTRGAAPGELGDHLLFWVGRLGYVGYGVVAGLPHRPRGKVEAPWPGGVYRFPSVVPFKLQCEVRQPIHLGFKNNVQEGTNFNTANFQWGMSRVSDDATALVVNKLLELELALPEA